EWRPGIPEDRPELAAEGLRVERERFLTGSVEAQIRIHLHGGSPPDDALLLLSEIQRVARVVLDDALARARSSDAAKPGQCGVRCSGGRPGPPAGSTLGDVRSANRFVVNRCPSATRSTSSAVC